MSNPSDEAVRAALAGVSVPGAGGDLLSLALVRDVRISGATVSFTLALSGPAAAEGEQIKRQAKDAVSAVAGVRTVMVELATAPAAGAPGGGAQAPQGPAQAPGGAPRPNPMPHIGHIVAVASGKGGVGKSSVAVNLALALCEQGERVGLMDCDFYGPSVPLMLGVSKKDLRQAGEKVLPARKHGLEILSFGFFVGERDPVVWRGPMLDAAIRQFFTDIAWSELDYLVIDMPPGTGDVQLSLCQRVPLAGALIVTTPQEVSLADVYKAVSMFNKVEVPILGVVENMSHFVCPNCLEKHAIFGTGGGQRLAGEIGSALLGQVPLDPRVVEGGDTGEPILLAADGGEVAQVFREIAKELAQRVQGEEQPAQLEITRA